MPFANYKFPEGILDHARKEEIVHRTTDLFVDLWLDDRGARVLDRDELDGARARGWIGEPTAVRALAEVERLRAAAESGSWPPPVVGEWTLARARAVLGG